MRASEAVVVRTFSKDENHAVAVLLMDGREQYCVMRTYGKYSAPHCLERFWDADLAERYVNNLIFNEELKDADKKKESERERQDQERIDAENAAAEVRAV